MIIDLDITVHRPGAEDELRLVDGWGDLEPVFVPQIGDRLDGRMADLGLLRVVGRTWSPDRVVLACEAWPREEKPPAPVEAKAEEPKAKKPARAKR